MATQAGESPVRRIRDADNPDPVHAGIYIPWAPINGKGGANLCGPYEPVEGWPKRHDPEWMPGSTRAVYAESPDRVIVNYSGETPEHHQKRVWGVLTMRDLRFTETRPVGVGGGTEAHRRRHVIVVYNREGTPIDCWDHLLDAFAENNVKAGGNPELTNSNLIRVNPYDPKRHIWYVGFGNTGIFKITNDGKEIAMKIDSKNVPEEYHPLIGGQEIAFLPNGDFIVGHNYSLMKFSEDGKFISAVGGQGPGPLEFDGIHGIEVHPETLNLSVYDRVNRRIQILDKDLNFIEEWPGFQGGYSIRLTADGRYLWVANGFAQKFLKYDMNGKLIRAATWGTFGISPGCFWGPHYFDTDSEGNLYIANDYYGGCVKFRPMADADPDDPQLIGQLAR